MDYKNIKFTGIFNGSQDGVASRGPISGASRRLSIRIIDADHEARKQADRQIANHKNITTSKSHHWSAFECIRLLAAILFNLQNFFRPLACRVFLSFIIINF